MSTTGTHRGLQKCRDEGKIHPMNICITDKYDRKK
jgi:hypothetical protein